LAIECLTYQCDLTVTTLDARILCIEMEDQVNVAVIVDVFNMCTPM